MPASMSAFNVKLDPIHTTLKKQLKNEQGSSKEDSLTERLTAASKQLLLSDIEYEHAQEETYLIKETLRKKYSCITDSRENVACSPQAVPRTSMNSSDGEPLKSPQKVLFNPREVRLGWQRRYPVGAGLQNVGNTCFLNSTLQTIIHCAPLVNWLLGENSHYDRCRTEGNPSMCTICAMRSVVQQAHQLSRQYFKPSQIISKLKVICKTMQLGRQEDAHEFLAHLLTSMAKSYLIAERALKQDQRSQETTPIHQIFGGYMRSQVKCLSCQYASNTYDHFQQIMLDLPMGCSTLNACLQKFFRKETLEGVNAYVCPRCKTKVRATKRFYIERPPNVLTITLKRFMSYGGKNSRHIEYGETVDLSSFMKDASEPKILYKLTGMVLHLGSSQHSGHYTAIAKAANSQFFYFDDENVRPIPTEHVFTKCPYIMFYEAQESFVHSVQTSPKQCAANAYQRMERDKSYSPSQHRMMSQSSAHTTNLFPKNGDVDAKKKMNTYPSYLPRVIDAKNKSTQSLRDPSFKVPEPANIPSAPVNNGETPVKLVPYEEDSEGDSNDGSNIKTVSSGICTVEAKERDKEHHKQSVPKKWTVTSITNKPLANGHSDGKRKERSSSEENYGAKKPRHADNYCEDRGTSGSILSKICSYGGVSGYGNSVRSWSGDRNYLDQDIAMDRQGRVYGRNDYDDDMDRGRVKKVKGNKWKRRWDHFNVFQRIQNHKSWRKDRWRGYQPGY